MTESPKPKTPRSVVILLVVGAVLVVLSLGGGELFTFLSSHSSASSSSSAETAAKAALAIQQSDKQLGQENHALLDQIKQNDKDLEQLLQLAAAEQKSTSAGSSRFFVQAVHQIESEQETNHALLLKLCKQTAGCSP